MTKKILYLLTSPGESADYRAARNKLLFEEMALRRQIESVADLRRALLVGGTVTGLCTWLARLAFAVHPWQHLGPRLFRRIIRLARRGALPTKVQRWRRPEQVRNIAIATRLIRFGTHSI